MSRRHSERGQGFAEFGIIASLFVVIALGVLTFGHAFLVMNMITHAARDGARLAATWTTRGPCHGLDNNNTGAIRAKVQSEIAPVTSATMNVNVTQNPSQAGFAEPTCNPPGGDPPTVIVTVSGCVPYIFPIVPTSFGVDCGGGQPGFQVNRAAQFADEGLGTPGGG